MKTKKERESVKINYPYKENEALITSEEIDNKYKKEQEDFEEYKKNYFEELASKYISKKEIENFKNLIKTKIIREI